MSNEKLNHSPGPWELTRYTNYCGFSVFAPGRGCIAERWYSSTLKQPYDHELLANAKLIAAAPDILSALIALRRACLIDEPNIPQSPGTIMGTVNEAILKAAPEIEFE